MKMDKRLKRRANILYRLRKKGFRCNTREMTIFISQGCDPDAVLQMRQLRSEYHFVVQLKIE